MWNSVKRFYSWSFNAYTEDWIGFFVLFATLVGATVFLLFFFGVLPWPVWLGVMVYVLGRIIQRVWRMYNEQKDMTDDQLNCLQWKGSKYENYYCEDKDEG